MMHDQSKKTTRSVFIPTSSPPFWQEDRFTLTTPRGAARGRAILELHTQANSIGYKNVLEISGSSPHPTGVALSAFNLITDIPGVEGTASVESIYQASKVFEGGGPYEDLLWTDSRSAKLDPRVRKGGALIWFQLGGIEYPIDPPNAFYHWLYLRALLKADISIVELSTFDAFTDIEFNPVKSVSCQAQAVASIVGYYGRHKVIPNLTTFQRYKQVFIP